MSSPEDIEQLLGLGAGDRLELVRELSLERHDVGLGFASGESIWTELELAPNWRELELGAAFDLAEWQEQAGVFKLRFASANRVAVARGVTRQADDQTWYIDARSAEATVRIELETGDDVVLQLSRGSCGFWRVTVCMAVPAEELFTRGAGLEPWIGTEYGNLSSAPAPHTRLAAVGLMLRLWEPTSPEARSRLLDETLVSGSPVVRTAKAWLKGVLPTLIRHCERLAVDDAEALEDGLLELDAALELGDDALRELAEHIALERDRLECIAAVLRLGGKATLLEGALQRLDQQASLYLSQLAAAGVEHPLLERVACVEPFAWWGALATD